MDSSTSATTTANGDDPAMARYKVHLEHRKMLHEAYREVSGRYSQAILTLSGGALALSMTYVEKLQPSIGSTGKWILCTAWIAFGLSLTFALWALYLSSRATQKAIENNDKEYLAREKADGVQTAQIHNAFGTFTKHFSWLALACSLRWDRS